MNYEALTFVQVDAQQVAELAEISRTTFYNAFAHLNNPDDIQAYIGKTFTTENLLLELNNPDSLFYFALQDGNIVGYTKFNHPYRNGIVPEPQALEIERIYVVAAHQGKSIGKKLIDFAVSEALKLDCTSIILGVWEHNLNAIRFYERHGFVIYGDHNFMLGTDCQTDLLMKKVIQ